MVRNERTTHYNRPARGREASNGGRRLAGIETKKGWGVGYGTLRVTATLWSRTELGRFECKHGLESGRGGYGDGETTYQPDSRTPGV